MIGTGLLAHPDLPSRLLRLLLAVAALALAAAWLTRLSAPRPVAVLPAPPVSGQPVNQASVMKVLGLGSGPGSQAAGIELTGLYARADGRGFATFRTPGGPLSGNAGADIQPGVRLHRLGSDHVILMIDNSERRLELPAKPAPPLGQAKPDQP